MKRLEQAAAQAEGPVGSGYSSSAGVFALYDETRLDQFRGARRWQLAAMSKLPRRSPAS